MEQRKKQEGQDHMAKAEKVETFNETMTNQAVIFMFSTSRPLFGNSNLLPIGTVQRMN